MSSQPVTYLTLEEYLELERRAEHKSEYYDGEIFPMEDVTPSHALVVVNLGREISEKLKEKPCRVYAGASLRIPSTNSVTMPDLMVVCGQPQFADKNQDTLLNPLLIVEVLSKTTGDYDRGGKFHHYRTLASLREYVTVAQEQPLIEVRARQEERRWEFVYYEGLDQTIPLSSIGCELSAAEVYDKVEFQEIARAARR